MYGYRDTHKLSRRRPSALPHSQNSSPCLVLVCIPYLGARRRDSRYSGKNTTLHAFFSCILSFYFFYTKQTKKAFLCSDSPAKEGGRRFKCLTDQYLPPCHFSGIIIILCNGNLCEGRRKSRRDRTAIPDFFFLWVFCFVFRASWDCMRRLKTSLPLKAQTFWDSVVWFHPGGVESGRPALVREQ